MDLFELAQNHCVTLGHTSSICAFSVSRHRVVAFQRVVPSSFSLAPSPGLLAVLLLKQLHGLHVLASQQALAGVVAQLHVLPVAVYFRALLVHDDVFLRQLSFSWLQLVAALPPVVAPLHEPPVLHLLLFQPLFGQ
ncbi:hypothetical protein PsorP6_003512 [Peronosclerospora sorghi]|uniref:Uncharacterized protein n=1 Tax=Peronosclerospora sorghi TaxID=230839 RepID=A0ACC0VRG8_9STRA|nr:hypothetical protein PsorP6_003512 [Peronosclerospora sorghi]